MELSITQALDLWDRQVMVRSEMAKCQGYYSGKHTIVGKNERYADGSKKSENVTNWPRYGVNRYVGAMTRKPYKVTARNAEDELAKLGIEVYADIARRVMIDAIDVDILRDVLINGRGIELHYFDPDAGGIQIANYDPLEWAVVYDSNEDVVAAIRRVTIPAGTIHQGAALADSLDIVTVYTDAIIAEYSSSGKSPNNWTLTKDPVEHFYGRVPVVEWCVNELRESLISAAVRSQTDEWNSIDSASGDDIRQIVDAMLVIKGYDADWVKQHESVINKSRMLPLSGAGDADAFYLTRQTDVARITERLKRTREAIHLMMEVPDVANIAGATGATSGIALKLMFTPMNETANAMIQYLKRCMKCRVDLINAMQEKQGLPQIVDYDMNIGFSIPVNELEEWQSIGALQDIVSHGTRLRLLHSIEDPAAELEAFNTEHEQRQLNAIKTPTQQAVEQQAMMDMAAKNMGPVMEKAIMTLGQAAIGTLTKDSTMQRIVERQRPAEAAG